MNVVDLLYNILVGFLFGGVDNIETWQVQFVWLISLVLALCFLWFTIKTIFTIVGGFFSKLVN